MKKIFVSIFLVCIFALNIGVESQTYGPPFPPGTFYHNGVIVSQSAFGLVGCPKDGKHYLLGDGTGCGDPIAGAGGPFLPLTGGTLSGQLIVSVNYVSGIGNRGVINYCNASGTNTQCYGELNVAQDSDSLVSGNKHLVGTESDVWAPLGPSNYDGVWGYVADLKAAAGTFNGAAFNAELSDPVGHPGIWSKAFSSNDGQANIALNVGAACDGSGSGTCNSQGIILRGYNSGVLETAEIQSDNNGNVFLEPASGQYTVAAGGLHSNGNLTITSATGLAGSNSNTLYLQYGASLNTSIIADNNGNIIMHPNASYAVQISGNSAILQPTPGSGASNQLQFYYGAYLLDTVNADSAGDLVFTLGADLYANHNINANSGYKIGGVAGVTKTCTTYPTVSGGIVTGC